MDENSGSNSGGKAIDENNGAIREITDGRGSRSLPSQTSFITLNVITAEMCGKNNQVGPGSLAKRPFRLSDLLSGKQRSLNKSVSGRLKQSIVFIFDYLARNGRARNN